MSGRRRLTDEQRQASRARRLAYKRAYEKNRRQRPEVQEYYRKYYQIRPKRKRKMREGLGVRDWWPLKKQIRGRVKEIVGLERFWAGEDYDFPFAIGGRGAALRPGQDLSEFCNGRHSIFVSPWGREDLKGLGVYYTEVDEVLQKGLLTNRQIQLAITENQYRHQREKITTAREIAERRQAYWNELARREFERTKLWRMREQTIREFFGKQL